LRRILISLVALVALLVSALAGLGWWWVSQPLRLRTPVVDLSIEPGALPRGVAEAVVDAGVSLDADWLFLWFRLSGQARQIKAGNYEIGPGTTPRSLLNKLVRGEEALRTLVIVEGWTFLQLRAALAKEEQLLRTTQGLSDTELMRQLGRPNQHPEGRFFPDTYAFAKGASDLALLGRALKAMDQRLAAAWAQRTAHTALKTPEQALILASIIEKETGRASERALISSVFNNRLRIGMPLQTDPTVIYGMGQAFDGNLRKKDLQTDTPWNTYTRNGLPPTPIALPGKASLLAAVQPAQSQALYFVARGDGGSQFSSTLQEHNRAVNQFQRARTPP
jgi:UPF0755 protein